MKMHHLYVAMVVVGTLIIGSWVKAQAQGGAARESTNVAVVDVGRVFNTCSEKGNIDANTQGRLERSNKEEEDAKEEIKQHRFDLDLISTDSPQFQEKRDEIEKKIIQFQAQITFRKSQIIRAQMRRYHNLYRKLREACGDVAKANGQDLVLFQERSQLVYKTPQELVNQIGGRKVLWAAEDLNITEQVIQKLNNDWNARENR